MGACMYAVWMTRVAARNWHRLPRRPTFANVMPRSVYFVAPFSLFILASAASPLACAAGEKSNEDRLLDKMSSEIDGVPSDTFAKHGEELAVDPVAPDASGSMRADSPSVPPPPPPAPIATPNLPVVHLAPDGTEETDGLRERARAVEMADDGERRPILSLTNASLGPARASHTTLPASARDKDAKHAYDAARKLVKAKHYSEALTAFSNFLVRWPEHANASDALYSRGECYLAQGAFANAAQAFEELITRFPTANKAPDALLKLGGVERVLRTQARNSAHAEYSDPPAAHPAARKEPPPSSTGPNAGLDVNDEDNEHLVRSDEDNEHIVGND